MTHPFSVTDQFIDDTLCTALEGGINYWARSAVSSAMPDDAEWTSDALSRGSDIDIVDDDGEHHTLTKAAFIKATRAFCKARKTTPARLEDDVPDAADADAIVQIALFGEVIYG